MAAKKDTKKEFRTLSDVLAAPAEEGLAVIAVCAPAICRIDEKSGIIDFMLENQGRAVDEQQGADLVAGLLRIVLKHCLGDCMDDCVEVLAAVNGMTVEQLKKEYSSADIIRMVKRLVSDKDFFTSLRTLAE